MSGVERTQRHSRQHRCPICDGADQDPRGQGKRCSGYTSPDGQWVRCSREDHAGSLSPDQYGLYVHKAHGRCNCGTEHAPAEQSDRPYTDRNVIYSYKDENGVELHQVVRTYPKGFFQRHSDGAGGWIKKMKGVRLVPYRLPELIASTGPVYIVEGEKDVDTLHNLGHVATCNAGGAGKWPSIAEVARKVLAGRDITIIADKDAPGRTHAQNVFDSLQRVARSIRIVECPKGKDVSDHLAAGGTLEELFPAYSPPTPTPSVKAQDPEDWRRVLLRKHDADEIKANVANVITILVNDPRWAGVLGYDLFAETMCCRKLPPWRPQDMPDDPKPGDWSDNDTVRLQSWLSEMYGIDAKTEAAIGAVKVVSARSPFHPVRDWLNSLVWDGTRRVRTWLQDTMGCEDTPYVREVGSCFMVGAVARIMKPGCKFDTVVIFEGDQGVGKSSAIRTLAGDEWFLEMSMTDVSNKDAMQILKRKWIAELPEIDGLSRTEAAHVKAYFSRQVDSYRPSYGKGTVDFPRQTAFIGSTNADQYLPDETGGRRFHPVKCKEANLPLLRSIREQLWAEALDMFTSGVEWFVSDPSLVDAFKQEQSDRYRAHPWEECIAAWLNKPLDVPPGTTRAKLGVTTKDVLEGALKVEVPKYTPGDAKTVAGCLKRLGWKAAKQSRRNGVQVRLFFPECTPDTPTDLPIPLPEYLEPVDDYDVDAAYSAGE